MLLLYEVTDFFVWMVGVRAVFIY